MDSVFPIISHLIKDKNNIKNMYLIIEKDPETSMTRQLGCHC